jgi:hypothetical protein
MGSILEFVKTDNFLLILFWLNIIFLIAIIFCIVKIWSMNKKYINFMKKIGNGNNLDEMLKKYLAEVKEIKKDNSEIKAYYTKLDNDLDSCIQKIGLVRYNAFKDVGSDLSFAIALLDNNNNGVVFNGLYGSESSNIYAKPIKNGKSTYQLSQEEEYAIEIAEQNKNFIARHKTNQLYKEN